MDFDHEYATQIQRHHIDTYGHVNNAVYLQLLEDARWDWIRLGGGSRQLVTDLEIGPIVVEIQIRFSKELKEGDRILIKSVVEGEISKTYYLIQNIYKENGDLACKSRYRMAFLDLKLRKIVDAPEVWRKILLPQRMRKNDA